HAYGDTGRTVYQQVRQARGQHFGNLFGAIVVVDEIHRFLVQIRQQVVADLGHAHFGITHGGRVVAIHRTEVALPVHQHVTQRKRLRHAHDGVVNSAVTVRMIFTDDVTDHTRRL